MIFVVGKDFFIIKRLISEFIVCGQRRCAIFVRAAHGRFRRWTGPAGLEARLRVTPSLAFAVTITIRCLVWIWKRDIGRIRFAKGARLHRKGARENFSACLLVVFVGHVIVGASTGGSPCEWAAERRKRIVQWSASCGGWRMRGRRQIFIIRRRPISNSAFSGV